MMLSTAVVKFLAEVEVIVSRNTYAQYKSDLELLVALAKVERTDNLVEFTHELVVLYLQKIKAKGLAAQTLHRRSVTIRQFAKWCLRHRLVAETPMVPSVKKPKRVPRPISVEAQDRITALDLRGPERVICGLLFLAGLRVSEVCGLSVQDVALGHDDQEGALTIRGKGDKERVVTIAPELWHALRDFMLSYSDLRGDSPLIARPDGKRWTPKMVQRRVRQWARRAGVKETVTPHRFRHRFASDLLNRGADLRVVQDILGHDDISTTAAYLEITDPRKREATNRLGRILRPSPAPQGSDPTSDTQGAAQPRDPEGEKGSGAREGL